MQEAKTALNNMQKRKIKAYSQVECRTKSENVSMTKFFQPQIR